MTTNAQQKKSEKYDKPKFLPPSPPPKKYYKNIIHEILNILIDKETK